MSMIIGDRKIKNIFMRFALDIMQEQFIPFIPYEACSIAFGNRNDRETAHPCRAIKVI
jgi:hypothetical protein